MRRVYLTGAVVVSMLALSQEAVLADESPSPELSGIQNSALTARHAITQLRTIGGVLIHFDDRKPGCPVILVDFTNHPKFQEEWLGYLAAFPDLSTLGLSGTSVSDAGLRYVRNLHQLENLTLAETKVTDKRQKMAEGPGGYAL